MASAPASGHGQGLLGKRFFEIPDSYLASSEHLAAGTDRGKHLNLLAGRAARNSDSGAVDLGDLVAEPMPREDETVGPEGVRQNHPAAGVDVRPGDLFDFARLRQVPTVRAGAYRQPPRLKLRTPAAVGNDGRLCQ